MTHATVTLSRREVLQVSAGALALGAIAVLPACNSDQKAAPPMVTTGIVNIGHRSDYPAGTVSNKYLKQYGIAIANDSGTVLAIRPICTHRGCLTAWQPDDNQFVCPCHHSHFNILGQPLSGLAKVAMKATAAAIAPDGPLTIDLDKVQLPKPATT